MPKKLTPEEIFKIRLEQFIKEVCAMEPFYGRGQAVNALQRIRDLAVFRTEKEEEQREQSGGKKRRVPHLGKRT